MSLAYIALGSNLDDRWANLSAAVRRLRAEPGLRVLKVSSFYETQPENCPPLAGMFLNAAMEIETQLQPESLLGLLLQIEKQLGRVRTEVNSPRTIDLDLLLYDNRIVDAPDLRIPHPRMHERAFVLTPLAEIAPHVIHPSSGKTVGQFAAELADRAAIVPFVKLPISTYELKGVRALVTGSTSGIGRAIAFAFAGAGAEVFIHGRSTSKIEETLASCLEISRSAGVCVRACQADLSNLGEVDRLADEAWNDSGGLDVLVCNAGADVLTGSAAKWSFDDKLDALLAIDLKATMRLSRNVGSRMKARGRGCIITIGWDQAETGMEGDSGQFFAAIKGAVICFTRSLAKSLAPEVRVNCIAPGWIRTAWGENASNEWQERVRNETPLGVWGLAEDVAETAVWLSSKSARFITGQTIRINGGAN
jgi:2-amino-4-hydroxy-6-hydroxymethyldihydropteridine diphosphokinase